MSLPWPSRALWCWFGHELRIPRLLTALAFVAPLPLAPPQAVELLQQNAAAAAELQAELATASAKLAELQDAHGVLAEAQLAQRAAAAATEAAGEGQAAASGG